MQIGLTGEELQAQIRDRMERLDDAQEDAEHLGPYGDLMRITAEIAYQRAAEMILVNNQRIAEQLEAMGIARVANE
ncbi:MAG TPA: hypothetical protein VGR16_07905 [Thermomicrobiales bacterium]|nr:hypothetical protein [Thermomicrobiales bacterium]